MLHFLRQLLASAVAEHEIEYVLRASGAPEAGLVPYEQFFRWLFRRGSPAGGAEGNEGAPAPAPVAEPCEQQPAAERVVSLVSVTQLQFAADARGGDGCWDGSTAADEEQPRRRSKEQGASDVRASFKVGTGFNATVGPNGVTALSLAPGTMREVDREAQAMRGLATQSAEVAVRGSSITWVRGEEIGRGAMGLVFRALNQKTGEVIAVKEVGLDAGQGSEQALRGALENELKIGQALRHPRIVSFLGYDFIGKSLYIYAEYMPGGSVSQVLLQFGPFVECLITKCTREAAEGLDYLHGQTPPILHRDIKGANLLVGLDCQVKLSDFGCSKLSDEDSTMANTMKGTIPWMAPEVIMRKGYGRKADVWSLGCVVVEMATAKPPWGRMDNPIAAMRKIGMSNELPPVPDSLPQAARSFISWCLDRDKEKRPSAADVLRHDFLRPAVDGDEP